MFFFSWTKSEGGEEDRDFVTVENMAAMHI